MTNDLAKMGAPAITNMDDLLRVSDMLSKSGYFEDAKTAAQCGVKVLAGAELGIPAFSSMGGIHIVKGKPSIGAHLMAAKVKGSGKYDYRVKKLDDSECTIVFLQGGEEIGISTFTKADAQKAGTQNMQKFGRNMLFARAMSNGVKWFTPDVFLTAVYTPEEMGVPVDGEGNVIQAEVVEPESAAKAPEPVARADTPDVKLSAGRASKMRRELDKLGFIVEPLEEAQLIEDTLGLTEHDRLEDLTELEALKVWNRARRITPEPPETVAPTVVTPEPGNAAESEPQRLGEQRGAKMREALAGMGFNETQIAVLLMSSVERNVGTCAELTEAEARHVLSDAREAKAKREKDEPPFEPDPEPENFAPNGPGSRLLTNIEASNLHKALAAFGIKEHYDFASEVMGRKINSLQACTVSVSAKIYEAAVYKHATPEQVSEYDARKAVA